MPGIRKNKRRSGHPQAIPKKQTSVRPSPKECAHSDCNGGQPSRNVGFWVRGDLYASYTMKSVAGQTTLAVGVNNVLDQNPPMIYVNAPDADPSAYDFMGGFFYGRLSQRF